MRRNTPLPSPPFRVGTSRSAPRTPRVKPTSGEAAIKILSKQYGFVVSGQFGSHIRLSKETPNGKVGTVVPLHNELKIGTLRSVLKLVEIDPGDFAHIFERGLLSWPR